MSKHIPDQSSTAEALLIKIIERDCAIIAARLRASDDPCLDDNGQPKSKRVSPSAETRARLREAAKRRPFVPFSEETRAKMSASAHARDNKSKLQSAVSPAPNRRTSHG
jgi:hypothetical protein